MSYRVDYTVIIDEIVVFADLIVEPLYYKPRMMTTPASSAGRSEIAWAIRPGHRMVSRSPG